ncbi:MAG: SCO family protein [Idiomarinaceae bacterium]|jgi:protein SCO1/2|nr:SCO family protein [Idiomarinaceae bacterium]HAD49238.1 SCO family protein [Idiomarina sp.]
MQKLMIVLAAVIAAAIGVASYQLWPKAEPEALVYQPPRAPAPFQLQSTESPDAINNQALKGQWTLLFTGYTFCPDICPTTMSDLKNALPNLQQHTDTPVKVWMISVDPKRDSMERLKEYTGYFGDAFVGIRAEHPQLFPFVRDLGLMYSVPEEGEKNYLVNHSAAIILVNPDGNRIAIFNADHQAGEIPVVDMEQLKRDFAIIAG